jgi:predicted nucleic acid-binding protein
MKIVLDLKVVMDTNVFVSGVFFSGPLIKSFKHGNQASLNLWSHKKFWMSIGGLEKSLQRNVPPLT